MHFFNFKTCFFGYRTSTTPVAELIKFLHRELKRFLGTGQKLVTGKKKENVQTTINPEPMVRIPILTHHSNSIVSNEFKYVLIMMSAVKFDWLE